MGQIRFEFDTDIDIDIDDSSYLVFKYEGGAIYLYALNGNLWEGSTIDGHYKSIKFGIGSDDNCMYGWNENNEYDTEEDKEEAFKEFINYIKNSELVGIYLGANKGEKDFHGRMFATAKNVHVEIDTDGKHETIIFDKDKIVLGNIRENEIDDVSNILWEKGGFTDNVAEDYVERIEKEIKMEHIEDLANRLLDAIDYDYGIADHNTVLTVSVCDHDVIRELMGSKEKLLIDDSEAFFDFYAEIRKTENPKDFTDKAEVRLGIRICDKDIICWNDEEYEKTFQALYDDILKNCNVTPDERDGREYDFYINLDEEQKDALRKALIMYVEENKELCQNMNELFGTDISPKSADTPQADLEEENEAKEDIDI